MGLEGEAEEGEQKEGGSVFQSECFWSMLSEWSVFGESECFWSVLSE